MNCDYLQANLYEYLDDALSPSAKAAADKHLADCSPCRETVQRERQREQSLAGRFKHAVESVELDALDRRNLAAAIARKTAPEAMRPGVGRLSDQRINPELVGERKLALTPALSPGERGKRLPRVWKMPLWGGFWGLMHGFFRGNLARPFAMAALLLATIWAGIHFFGKEPLTAEINPTPAESAKVRIDLTYSVPGYVFRKDGNQVIDALTSDTLDANAAILANN